MTQTCGRPTRKQQPCRAPVQRIYRWPQPSHSGPACSSHLTDEERAAFDALKAEDDAEFHEAHQQAPACHSWPAVERVELNEWERGREQRRGPGTSEPFRMGRQLIAWQAGRCALCGGPGANVEDHCHRTGLFRGWLCRSCNTREGLWDTALFRQYRERPPAVIVGYTYQYDGYGCADGAEPEQWVVDVLGPQPPDHSPEAVAYLAAAAALDKPRHRPGNPLKRMGL